jgi:hypothetical protein
MREMTTVSQLVDFAKCEKLAILKRTRRETLNEVRQTAVDRGTQAHARFEKQSTVDGRCFVSSFAFGPDAVETMNLRAYRDSVMLRSKWGASLVAMYYLMSPLGVALLRRLWKGDTLARLAIRLVSKLLRIDLERQ